MKVSGRPVRWRLVGVLLVALCLVASVAAAETVRVTIGPASIYERPRTNSDVMLTVPEGTVLEVLRREGQWYWVLLPRDSNGMRRSGYIPAYVVERVGNKGLLEPGIPGAPSAETGPARPEPVRPMPRFLAGISWGEQYASSDFTDLVTFPKYQTTGTFTAEYSVPSSSLFDANFGVRLGGQVFLAFSYVHTSMVASASVTAQVPHPNLNLKRPASGAGYTVNREENDGHVQFTYQFPLGHGLDLAVYGGPSVFHLQQDLIKNFTFLPETGSIDTAFLGSVSETAQRSKAVVGVNVGADLSFTVWRFLGAGVGVRYAHGSMHLPSAGDGTIPVVVGGVQLSGGLRFQF